MSEDEKAAFAKTAAEHPMACPRCKSANIRAENYDGDRVLSCDVICTDCDLAWTELYRLQEAVNFRENADDGDTAEDIATIDPLSDVIEDAGVPDAGEDDGDD